VNCACANEDSRTMTTAKKAVGGILVLQDKSRVSDAAVHGRECGSARVGEGGR
jgi:hypothetical protein